MHRSCCCLLHAEILLNVIWFVLPLTLLHCCSSRLEWHLYKVIADFVQLAREVTLMAVLLS
jgi:hypothetical protein